MTKLRLQGHSLSAKAIVFDKDGTLADSHNFLWQLACLRIGLCADLLRSQGIELTTSQVQSLRSSLGVDRSRLDPEGLMATATRLANQQVAVDWLLEAGYPEEGVVNRVVECFQIADRQLWPKARYTPPFSGTPDLLKHLTEGGIPVGVLSSDGQANVGEFLSYYRIADYVQAWRGTEIGEPSKPSPSLFYQVCHHLGVEPCHTLVVGDSRVDYQLAQRAGAAGFISVSEAWGRPPVVGAKWVVYSWQDLQVEA